MGCTPSEAPKPAPTSTAAPVVAAPVPTSTAPEGPKPTANAAAADDPNDFSDTADWEWNLDAEADGPDFAIDADATSYYMPENTMVTFKGKALNGTPPFSWTWNFADGSPEGTGEMIKHRFTTTGSRVVLVTCSDSGGQKTAMELRLLVTTWSEYKERMHVDEEDAPPSPAVTP